MNESYIILGEIEISPLIRAADKFQQFLANAHSEQEKSGTIQAFEYTYDLSWKIMKRVLKHQGIDANSPRETFREAAVNKIIDNVSVWDQAMQQSMATSNTYLSKSEMNKTMHFLTTFENAVLLFLNKIKTLS